MDGRTTECQRAFARVCVCVCVCLPDDRDWRVNVCKCFHVVCVGALLHAAVSGRLNEPYINTSAGAILVDFQESVQLLFQMS